MYRVLKLELYNFLKEQNIPKVDAFLDLKEGRPQIFKKSVEKALDTQGLFLDFGVMSGGTTNQISALIPDKTLYSFDSFEGISEDYSDIHRKGAWRHEIPKLNPNVKLIIGYYQDTLKPFLEEHKEKVSFVHTSSGLYSSTKYLLDTLQEYNRLQVGTVVQFDTIFYVEEEYWYQDEFKAWNELIDKYNIKADYLAWAGFCHCSYLITKI